MKKLATILAAALIVAACAPAPPPPPAATGGSQPPAEKRSSNQVLRVAQASIPTSLSPEAGETHRGVFWLMYDMPIVLDGQFNVKPWAAERWELVNPTTFRLTLRKDLVFSNGDKLTADDVEFTIKHMVSTKTPPISRFRSLIDAKMVDPYTIDLINKAPDASTLNALSYLVILPRAYFEKVGGSKGFAAAPIGSGPYELAELRSNTQARFTLRSTPHPFRKPIPTEVVVNALPEISAVMAGLRTGDIDIAASVTFSSDQLTQLDRAGIVLQKRLNSNIQVAIPWSSWQSRDTPLKDQRVRLALNYAVDKDALNQKFYRGEARPTGNLVAEGSQFWSPTVTAIPYDPKRAKELLAAAGYPTGFKLPATLDFSTTTMNSDVIFAIQGYLREVGVEIEVLSNEYGLFVDKFLGKVPKGDLFGTSMPDPDGFNSAVRAYYGCEYVSNAPLYCNPEFDRLNSEAAAETDQAKRVATFRRATDLIFREVNAIYLLELPVYVVNAPKIKGFSFDSSAFYLLENAYRVE